MRRAIIRTSSFVGPFLNQNRLSAPAKAYPRTSRQRVLACSTTRVLAETASPTVKCVLCNGMLNTFVLLDKGLGLTQSISKSIYRGDSGTYSISHGRLDGATPHPAAPWDVRFLLKCTPGHASWLAPSRVSTTAACLPNQKFCWRFWRQGNCFQPVPVDRDAQALPAPAGELEHWEVKNILLLRHPTIQSLHLLSSNLDNPLPSSSLLYSLLTTCNFAN